jgi:Glycosyltransferase family 87
MLPSPLVRLGAAGLVVLALAYQAKGTLDLVWGTGTGSAVDLRSRHDEQALFAAGENPFEHGIGSQPPWGYPTGILLTWPPWPTVRAYFAVVNLAALLYVMWWASWTAKGLRSEDRWLLMGAAAAFGGSCTATEVGQIGIVVAALLGGSLWCDARGHTVWAGLLVALALIKPTIAAPFAIALLVTGRSRASLAAAAFGVVASLVTWAHTGAPPWRMLEQLAQAAGGYANAGTIGLVDTLAMLGAPPLLLNPAAAVLVSVPGLLLMWAVRPSLPLAFAVAAAWGRMWTYHKSYDDVMLVFLLVPLGVAVLGGRGGLATLGVFGLMGGLAWLPGRLLDLSAVQVAQVVIWPTALGVLLSLPGRTSGAEVVSGARLDVRP